MSKIMVFEDRDRRFNDLERGWNALRGKNKPALDRYVPPNKKGPATKDARKRLEKENVSMVIVDEDLSRYPGQGYVVSADVKKHCRSLGIPICAYSKESDEYQLNESQSWAKAQVTLDSRAPIGELAARCSKVHAGFQQIREAFKAGHQRAKKFNEILPPLLDAPEVAVPQINQYAWGHLEILGEVHATRSDPERALTLAGTAAGYWLFNVLMRFPGVLLNDVAAASHLGVSPRAFAKSKEAQAVFAGARYKGPFANLNKIWWRTRLDEILAKESDKAGKIVGGREALALRGIALPEVKCADGHHKGAGYYCILTNRPVCQEHSVAPKRWLPLGADKSRVSKSVYETMDPLLGL